MAPTKCKQINWKEKLVISWKAYYFIADKYSFTRIRMIAGLRQAKMAFSWFTC